MPTKRKQHRKAHCECGASCMRVHGAQKPMGQAIVEVLGMLAFIVVVWKAAGLFGFTPSLMTRSTAAWGGIFFLGLFATFSGCGTLAGTLVLSITAAWREDHEHAPERARLIPVALFHTGRLLGFLVLGGVLGAIGSSLTLTPRLSGVLSLIVAIVMLGLALRLLHLLPRSCTVPGASRLAQKYHGLVQSGSQLMVFAAGALTFFIPCGFTQTAQLLALSSGTPLIGALVMLTFALGTLPSLLGLSLLGIFSEGRFEAWLLRFSGILVLVMGLVSLRGSLLLLGVSPRYLPSFDSLAARSLPPIDPNVQIDGEGRQILPITVTDQGFFPSTFTIRPDLPTLVRAVAPQPVGGCASFLLAPAFNLSIPVHQGENWLGPLNPQYDFVLTCSMGTYRVDVHVRS